jgi:NAD(P)-dependent dehydrogenase (short-subunit alcohol dehydrogenase family)
VPDLSGKTAIVTGANSGFGLVTTRELASMGAKVIMACRSRARAEAAAAEIRAGQPEAALDIRVMDLANQAEIRALAAALERELPRLDILVNNAGITANSRELGPDGIERVFATNVMGPYLLTKLLRPLLLRSAPARVVNVASEFCGELDLDDLQVERRRYTNTRAYKQSKACDLLLTGEFARQLAGTGVTVNAVGPGLVASTGIFREQSRLLRWFLGRVVGRGRTVEQGADTIVWLASAPELDGVTGKFFVDRRETAHAYEDPVSQRRLWEACADLER